MKIIPDQVMTATLAIYQRVRNIPFSQRKREDGELFLTGNVVQAKPCTAGAFYGSKLPTSIGADWQGWSVTYPDGTNVWWENTFFAGNCYQVS